MERWQHVNMRGGCCNLRTVLTGCVRCEGLYVPSVEPCIDHMIAFLKARHAWQSMVQGKGKSRGSA